MENRAISVQCTCLPSAVYAEMSHGARGRPNLIASALEMTDFPVHIVSRLHSIAVQSRGDMFGGPTRPMIFGGSNRSEFELIAATTGLSSDELHGSDVTGCSTEK